MAALWVQALPPEPDQNKRFRGNPGLREMPNRDSPPIMYVYLLFTVQLMKEIVRRTNRYVHLIVFKKLCPLTDDTPVQITNLYLIYPLTQQ
jgi:hypothetical protein